jgi:hypothetical protein
MATATQCGPYEVLCKTICLVTNISSQNLLLHMTCWCSLKLLLSSVSRPWPYRQRYSWRKVLGVKSSVLCCARVTHFITIPKAKTSKSCHLKQIVAEFGDDIFSTDGHILYCKKLLLNIPADSILMKTGKMSFRLLLKIWLVGLHY